MSSARRIDLGAVSDEHVFRPLRPLATGLAVIFAAAIVVNLLEGLPERAVVPLVVFDAALALTFVALRVALGRGWFPARSANPIGVAMAALTLANIFLAYAFVGEPYYLLYVGIVLIGCGFFLLSIPWLVLSLVAANIAWLVLAWSQLSVQQMLHYGFSVWIATAVSVIVFVARRRAVFRMEEVLQKARLEAEQRRQAEEAMAETSEQLSLAIAASKGGWWHLALNPDSPSEFPNEIEIDPTLKGFIGFEDREIPNSMRAWTERMLPDDMEAALQSARAHLMGETPLHEVHYRIRHRDGTLRRMYSCGRVERDSQGRPVRMSGIDWDVTERFKTEELLRKLSRAVEQSSSLILITDIEGRIEYVNPKFTRTTGYSLQEAVGKTPAMLKSEKTPRELHQELWTTILAGHEWQGEFENVKKDGTSYWAIASISPARDKDGKITHFVGVQEDITERRQVEEQLIQAQKMEGVGQLVSGVAHDFNNLLTGIVGFSDLALASVGEDDPMRSNLQQISKAGESAMALTRQLLAFSRQQVLQPRVVDLNRVISDFEDLLRRTISENIKLVVEKEPALGRVNVDPTQMEQILVNLAVNARDAMPNGGSLTVATRNIELDQGFFVGRLETVPGRYVCLEVSDTGIGMDDETKRRVFEPFFTTKERGSGTGLGLATVYGIVKQSGGYIWVESAPGSGTTFRICLPRVQGAVSSEQSSRRESVSDRGSEKILLVEDDELVRSFALRLLRSKGYEVLETASAAEALEMGDGDRFDLLITDVVMPGMSGVELADELSRSRPELKVLFLSGYTDLEVIEEKLLDPRAGFLAKPFGVDEFVRTVRAFIDR